MLCMVTAANPCSVNSRSAACKMQLRVAFARRGRGMYNFPKAIRDPLNALLTKHGGRGQTLETVRQRYEAAYAAAVDALEAVDDQTLSAGANFWGEGFFDIAGLYSAQADHLAEHADDVRLAVAHRSGLGDIWGSSSP